MARVAKGNQVSGGGNAALAEWANMVNVNFYVDVVSGPSPAQDAAIFIAFHHAHSEFGRGCPIKCCFGEGL